MHRPLHPNLHRSLGLSPFDAWEWGADHLELLGVLQDLDELWYKEFSLQAIHFINIDVESRDDWLAPIVLPFDDQIRKWVALSLDTSRGVANRVHYSS